MYLPAKLPAGCRLKPMVCTIMLLLSSGYVAADETERELGTVVVNGEADNKDQTGRDNVYAKDVSNAYVGKDDIERYKGLSVGDLFNGLNGVYSGDSRNSGALDPNIRGIQGEGRVPVTVDGAEQSTSVWMGPAGVANRSYVDPNMISSIMVERGVSMTPGVKSGVGGTVQIKTLGVDDIVRPGETFGLEVKMETGTNTVKANDGQLTSSFGKDYRDLYGAYTSSWGNVIQGGINGTNVIPRKGPNNSFDFGDKAYRVAMATKQENFSLLGAYSYRSRGNYYSGKNGSEKYKTDSWREQMVKENEQNLGSGNQSYMANMFLPQHEVNNTSSQLESTLLKGSLNLPNNQTLSASLMRMDSVFGESIPYLTSFMLLQSKEEQNIGYQFPPSQVKQDTYTLNYAWNPADNPLIDFNLGVWMTKSNASRHQNGDGLYGVRVTSFAQQDTAWDNYVRCHQLNDPTLNCTGVPSTPPEKKPNTDGRYNIFAKALQLTNHDRKGIDVSNRFQLTPTLKLGLAADFSHEKLEQRDASEGTLPTEYTWGNRYMGPRSGTRQQYNFTISGEWAATDWLVLNAGLRYSDYNSYDDALKKHRQNQDKGWELYAPTVGAQINYQRAMTDAEFANALDGIQFDIDLYQQLIDDPDSPPEYLADYAMYRDESQAFKDSTIAKGVMYTDASVIVPYDGFKMDQSQNPFRNGQINLKETMISASGIEVPRYIVNTYNNYHQLIKGAEPADKWALPEKNKDHAWTPSFGATVFLTDHTRVYGRYSELVRFPSIYEDTQAMYGFGGGSVSTNNMVPEHTYSWEIGYVHDLKQFLPNFRAADFRINYYNNTIRNYVDRDFTFNIRQYDKKIFTGIDLQARLDSGKYFANFGASYRLKNQMCDKNYAETLDPYFGEMMNECVTAGFPTTFARTSLQPKYSLNLDAGMRLLNNDLELGSRMVYHSTGVNEDERAWIANNIKYVHAFNEPNNWNPIMVFDAYASYRLNKHMQLDFMVNNITDRYYLDPLARSLMPAPGRTMKVALTMRY
jgi:hemoglobin/transferrin/lactoferrin receptor protein